MSANVPISTRTTGAALWLIASRLGTRAIDFASLLLLARILTPNDFGLVAIAMTLVQMVEAIFELPVGQVLLRSEAVTETMLRTAFTLGLLRGLLLALVLALLSWPFAYFYGDPRLIPLICFISLSPAARGLMSPKMVEFARAIDFRRDLVVEIAGKAGAFAVAVPCAILTRSYWAIAAASVAGPVVMMAVTYVLAPFRVRLSVSGWRNFAGFIGWTTASQVVSALNWQIDRLILGRLVSKGQLGAFSLASDLSGLPEQAIVRPIARPLLAAFSLVRHDEKRLGEAYLRSASTLLAAGLPLMLTLSLLAEPVVRFALGPKWQTASPYLQWMALVLVPALFTSPLWPLAMATGRVEVFLRLNLCELITKTPVTVMGTIYFGAFGAVGARGVAAIVTTIASMVCIRSIVGLPVRRQLTNPWRPLVAAAGMVAVLLTCRPALHAWSGMQLGIGIAACSGAAMLAYMAALFAMWERAGRPQGLEATIFAAGCRLFRPLVTAGSR